MQSVFVIITSLIASRNYFCKEVFCNNFGHAGILPVSENRRAKIKRILVPLCRPAHVSFMPGP